MHKTFAFHELKVYFPSNLVRCVHLFKLLLGAQVVSVSTLGLPAVGGSWVKTSIALAADHFVAVVLHSKNTQGWLNDTTTETQHQVEGGLYNKSYFSREKITRFVYLTLLDVVVRQSASIFELLASKNQTLLIRGDALFILDFCLHILNSIGRLNLEGNRLTRQSLDEDLHLGLS